jgi:single-stranded DNA-binding protein
MSELVLISGRLQGEPVTRPTRNGGEFVAFKLKVSSGNRLNFWSVTSFSATVREELEGLTDGAAVACVGELHVESYEWKGETRIALKMTADRVLGLKPKPKAKQEARQPHEKASSNTAREIASKSWGPPAPVAGGAIVDDAEVPF